jgi:hypothetical protein
MEVSLPLSKEPSSHDHTIKFENMMALSNFICDYCSLALISKELCYGSLTDECCTMIQVILLNLVGHELHHINGNQVKLSRVYYVDFQHGNVFLKLPR